jgi:hypothetical protein
MEEKTAGKTAGNKGGKTVGKTVGSMAERMVEKTVESREALLESPSLMLRKLQYQKQSMRLR